MSKCMCLTVSEECLWKSNKDVMMVFASGNEKWEAENQGQEGGFCSLSTVFFFFFFLATPVAYESSGPGLDRTTAATQAAAVTTLDP